MLVKVVDDFQSRLRYVQSRWALDGIFCVVEVVHIKIDPDCTENELESSQG